MMQRLEAGITKPLELLVAVGSELDDVALDENIELDDCAEDEFAESMTSDDDDCNSSADDSGNSEDDAGFDSNDVGGANSAGPLLLFSQPAKKKARAIDIADVKAKVFCLKFIFPPYHG
jgi:hypothetical protein